MAATGNYQPKGGMCMNCKKSRSKCDHLPFETMPVIVKIGEVTVVKCTEFERK